MRMYLSFPSHEANQIALHALNMTWITVNLLLYNSDKTYSNWLQAPPGGTLALYSQFRSHYFSLQLYYQAPLL